MKDQIKARAAQIKRAMQKESAVLESAQTFANQLVDAFAEMDVSGQSIAVPVDDPERKLHGLEAYLSFTDGKLAVAYDPEGRASARPLFRVVPHVKKQLGECPQDWLQKLFKGEVLKSLIHSIGGGDEVAARDERAEDTLTEMRAFIHEESAAIDAEATASLEQFGREHLIRTWREAVDATHGDTADALTRCSRFLEAVCTLILRERGVELPAEKSMAPLVKACHKSLDWPESRELKGDVDQLQSGIRSICGGIGSLRTHFGTAHGASSHLPPLDPAYAVFVKNATAATAIFLLNRHQASPPAAHIERVTSVPSEPSPAPAP